MLNLMSVSGNCRLTNEVCGVMSDNNMELIQQFNDYPSFQKWLVNMMFSVTYSKQDNPFEGQTAV